MKPSTIVDERIFGSPEPPNGQNGVNDGTSRSQLYQRWITHATTVLVANNRYTAICTLENRPTKDDSTITTPTVHHRIFDAIKQIDASAAIISLNQTRITHSKDIPSGDEYKKIFKDCRTYDTTKRVYVSFKLELTHTISQLYHGSTINDYKGIIDTLREYSTFLKMNKFQSHTNAIIGFFFDINPKFTLQKVLKEKIDEIYIWLNLYDDETKALAKKKYLTTHYPRKS